LSVIYRATQCECLGYTRGTRTHTQTHRERDKKKRKLKVLIAQRPVNGSDANESKEHWLMFVDVGLLGYTAVWTGRQITFRRNILPQSSGLNLFLTMYIQLINVLRSYYVMFVLLSMFRVMTPCRLEGRCQRFGETSCLHLQGCSSLPTNLHGAKTQSIIIILTAVKTSDLTFSKPIYCNWGTIRELALSSPCGRGCKVTAVLKRPPPRLTRCGVSVCTLSALPDSTTSRPSW
jgi:hypothetical protein